MVGNARKLLALALLLATLALAGCLGNVDDARDAAEQAAPDPLPVGPSGDDTPEGGPSSGAEAAYPRCEHPWPCGDGAEWPRNLTGPFDVARVEEVDVASFDGTTLHGWLMFPEAPEDVELPVVLGSTPYAGQTSPAPGDAGFGDYTARVYGVNLTRVAEQGYVVAVFDVRGTGQSGGCFEMFGPREQRDQAALVEWLGDRDWSNGRVGMMGRSYRGTTPFEAAIQDPEPLKTMVVSGIVSDLYTFYHTPQGAASTFGPPFQAYYDGLVTGPPVLGTLAGGPAPERATTGWLPVAPDRACPEVVDTMESLWTGTATDVRDAEYWAERRLVDDFPNVTSSVLLAHGFEDRWGSGHYQQELAAWESLPSDTPKYQVEGQWEHEFPNQNSNNPDWTIDDWGERVLDWLDFWLKGLGDPPETLGTVDYQDSEGTWHDDTAWPPSAARQEVLHLAGQGLDASPGDGARFFRSVPDEPGSRAADAAMEGWVGPLCTRDDPSPAPPHGLLYRTDPLEEDTLVAGNPFAYLRVTADQPGGHVAVALLDLGPDFRCEGADPVDARALTVGRADLRFHDGNMMGTDFPTGEATWVRIDLTNAAEVVPAGHELAAFVSFGDAIARTGQPYAPGIDVHADSELVLPVVDGDLGGDEPTREYPPRPFVPGNAS